MISRRIVLWPLAFFPWIDYFMRLLGDHYHVHPLLAPAWDDLFLLFGLSVVLPGTLRRHQFPNLPAPIRWILFAFVSTCVLSVFVNGVPLSLGIEALRVTFQPMLFSLITMILLRDEELRHDFIDLIVVNGALIALLGLGQYLLEIESWRWINKPHSQQFRVVSIFAKPNALAGYLNMVLALSLSRALFSVTDRAHKIVYSIACLCLTGALTVTYSRSGWISCIVMVLLYATVMKKRWLVGLIALAAIALLMMSTSVTTRLLELTDPAYYRQSAHFGRLGFWSKALTTIREYPLLGAGMGMAGGSLSIRNEIPGATWVDNHYLKVGAETGLMGLLSFAMLIAALFAQCRKAFHQAASDREKATALGVAGVLLVMTIQNITASIWEALYVAVHFYAFVGILFTLPGKASTHVRENP